jgi:spermidine synthase
VHCRRADGIDAEEAPDAGVDPRTASTDPSTIGRPHTGRVRAPNVQPAMPSSPPLPPLPPLRSEPSSPGDLPAGLGALAALTVFVGAFLLFLIQPIASKQILPWYGGSAAVWAVCLAFFQVALLVGYAYAHVLQRLVPPRWGWVGHAALLALAVATLEVLASAAWKPAPGETRDPSWQIVALLTASVGLPYVLLAATGPLVQSWMARAGASERVYRLFALGNLASILGLLAYPFGVEPHGPLAVQASAWAFGFGLYAGLCAWTGFWCRRAASQRPPEAAGSSMGVGATGITASSSPWAWFALSALGSALLVATTNHLTRDVASVPFLWVLPLALYLLSFVLVFDTDRFIRAHRLWAWAALAAVLWCAVLVPLAPWIVPPTEARSPLPVLVASFLGALALACLWLHGELARSKPAAARLTRFYLVIATGGAAGGLLVALAAPRILPAYYELGIAYILFAACIVWRSLTGPDARARGLARRWASAAVAGLAVGVCALLLGFKLWVDAMQWRSLERNFYGVLATGDRRLDEPAEAYRVLAHGSIRHGAQYLAPARRREATTYYTPRSGVARAIEATRMGAIRERGQRVGTIGLGAGTTAVYGRAGDVHRFYEINPLVIEIAAREFSFLADSRAAVETVLGDARLVLEAEPPQAYDVLAIDAFSGDAVPAHLLTREALRAYRRHLAPGGVLAFHISNQHLDLAPVVATLAREAGMAAVRVRHGGPANDISGQSADWVLVADSAAVLAREPIAAAAEPVLAPARFRAWSDDFNDLLGVLRW